MPDTVWQIDMVALLRNVLARYHANEQEACPSEQTGEA